MYYELSNFSIWKLPHQGVYILGIAPPHPPPLAYPSKLPPDPGSVLNSSGSDLGHPVQYLTLASTLTKTANSPPSPPGLDSWLFSTFV